MLCLLAFSTAADTTNTQILGHLETTENRLNNKIEIYFLPQIRLLKKQQTIKSNRIEIPFRFFGDQNAEDFTSGNKQLIWQANNQIPLTSVTYDKSFFGNPMLTLYFTRQVNASIRQAGDAHSIIIEIPRVKTRAANTKKTTQKRNISNKKIGPKKLNQIMENGRDALTRNNARKAINFFNIILGVEHNEHSQQALELSGLARERLGQRAHAKADYELYLDIYQDGEGATRVRQRLKVLLTAKEIIPTSEKVKKFSKRKQPGQWDFYGSLSQFYRITDDDNSEIFSYLGLTGRKRNQKWDIRTQFTGTLINPIKDVAEDNESSLKLSELFIDLTNKENNSSYKLGRLKTNQGGLFNRFDGGSITLYDSSETRYNLVFGLPVDGPSDSFINQHKSFAGANIGATFLKDKLELTAYVVGQENDGISDRESFGLEAVYFEENLTVFSLLDYNILYEDVNFFLITGNWKVSESSTYYINIDIRKSPFLTTSNALIGQDADSLDDLSNLSLEEIQQLALDRTSDSEILNLGLAYKYDDDTRLRGDISVSNLSATESTAATGNINAVTATPESNGDIYLSFQIIKENYLTKRDVSVLQFQISDTTNVSSFRTKVSSRLRLGNKWRVTPFTELTFRDYNTTDGGTTFSTGGEVDYRYGRNMSFELDLTVDAWNDNPQISEENFANLYLSIGYRWLF